MKLLKFLFAIAVIALTACSQQEDFHQSSENREEAVSLNGSPLENALKSAEKIMVQLDNAQTRASSRKVSSLVPIVGGTRSTVAQVYLVNYEHDGGFAVILINGKSSEIYAVSNEGHLETSDTLNNIGLTIFFRGVENEAKKLSAQNSSPEKSGNFPVFNDSIMPPIVDSLNVPFDDKWIITGPLLTKEVSKWKQSFPFNKYCPDINGQRTLAGCSAVACAQALSYYRPTNYLSTPIFNWDVINSWTSTGYNDYDSVGEAGGLFKLLRQLGNSENLKISYGLTASSSYGDISQTIRNFGLSCKHWDGTVASEISVWNNNTVEDWIYSKNIALIEGRILYPQYNSPGHLWLADGVMFKTVRVHPSLGGRYGTEDQLFHCVWGWGGKNNGWYKIIDRTLQKDGSISDNPYDPELLADCGWLGMYLISK